MRARHPVLFTAAYGAGLATGLLHFVGPLPVIGIAGILVLAARCSLMSLLSTAAILGSLSAHIAVKQERGSCAVRLPEGRLRLAVRLLDPVDSVGGRVELEPIRVACAGTISGRWPPGHPAQPGTVITVTGRWIPRQEWARRPSGTFVVFQAVPTPRDTVAGQRLRRSLTGASRSLYGNRAPMVDALILGRRGGIDRTLQDRFAQSGLVHLLSISGFHVGVITAWIFLVCRLLRIGRSRALGLAAGVSVAYVAFLGWPAPAT
ncbi:MAG TPA: ComEC/Rec2 family competence protein, partial [Gemmatimonadales bacterium]|nr:ComEC/Rec2 family competence protein [Gemmatimonadales bacterium]